MTDNNEPLTCDKCGCTIDEQYVLYHFNGVPYLLCPECAERKDEEDFDD